MTGQVHSGITTHVLWRRPHDFAVFVEYMVSPVFVMARGTRPRTARFLSSLSFSSNVGLPGIVTYRATARKSVKKRLQHLVV